MEYRHLGTSGLVVSALGLGTNNLGSRLDEVGSRAVVDAALEAGVTFIDTADVYGKGASETMLGAILSTRRADVVLATKAGIAFGDRPWQRGSSRHWLLSAVEGSLRRLRTDWIDLYQMHVPDPTTPIEETLRALDDLVRAGKVRYVGTSNYAAWQIVDAQWTAQTERLARPISVQHHYNLIRREIEADVLPAARAHGLGLIPFFPLASGFLTGKYRAGERPTTGRLIGSPSAAQILTDANFERLAQFEAFATERGRAVVDLAFAWLLSQPDVGPVIASASSPEQVRTNAVAAEWRLTQEELAAVAAL
jgi:aryl-alcohol dehydrogenase-like predicted oxidoreductase